MDTCLTPEQRQEATKARNRESARRMRLRKKDRLERMQNRLVYLEQANYELYQENLRLKRKVEWLEAAVPSDELDSDDFFA